MLLEGKIQTRCWDDKQSGQKKYRTEIIVWDLTLLDGGQQRSTPRDEMGTDTEYPEYDARGEEPF